MAVSASENVKYVRGDAEYNADFAKMDHAEKGDVDWSTEIDDKTAKKIVGNGAKKNCTFLVLPDFRQPVILSQNHNPNFCQPALQSEFRENPSVGLVFT